jgi:hypothetical protein
MTIKIVMVLLYLKEVETKSQTLNPQGTEKEAREMRAFLLLENVV